MTDSKIEQVARAIASADTSELDYVGMARAAIEAMVGIAALMTKHGSPQHVWMYCHVMKLCHE